MTAHARHDDIAAPADAIEDLYRAHAARLARLALLLVGDHTTAEDVVQEAYENLHRGWHRIREAGNVVGYLHTSVVNGCRSVHRRRSRAKLLRMPHEIPVWSAEAAVMDREERRWLLTEVARLPRRQREVLALKYYLDLNEQEIARILGVSRGTVASACFRALRTLARELREEQ